MNRPKQPTKPATRHSPQRPTRGNAVGRGRGQSPPQKKGGLKARKDLQTDEANIRSEAMIAYQQEFERITELFATEMVTVKERLISRLERNLNETSARAQDTVKECKEQVKILLGGVATFHNELTNAAQLETVVDINSLIDDNRPLNIVAGELKQLAQDVTRLIARGTEKVATAEKRIYQLEDALSVKSAEVASVERMFQDTLVRGTSDISSSIEKTRQFGIDLRGRMEELEKGMQTALDDLIQDTAVACYDANAYPKHVGIVSKDTAISEFFSKAEEGRIQQAALLRDVRVKIVELTKEKLVQLDELGKNSVSNLPESYQNYIASPTHFSRDDLVHLLGYVTFEPRVAEAIIAVLDEYQALAENEEDTTILDIITKAATQTPWKKGDNPTLHDSRLKPIQSNLILTPSKQNDPPIEPLLMASPAAKHFRLAQMDKKQRDTEQLSYAMFRSKEPGFRFPVSAPSSAAASPRKVALKEASPSSVLFSQKQREILSRLEE